MCVIVGVVDFRRQTNSGNLCGIVGELADSLRLRGLDDEGAWADGEEASSVEHVRGADTPELAGWLYRRYR